MDEWDWGDINVLTGELWLALIGLALFLTGLALGYVLGQQRERKACEERYAAGYWDQPPPGGAHREVP